MSKNLYLDYSKARDTTKIVTKNSNYTFFRALTSISALAILVSIPFVIFISIIALTISLFF